MKIFKNILFISMFSDTYFESYLLHFLHLWKTTLIICLVTISLNPPWWLVDHNCIFSTIAWKLLRKTLYDWITRTKSSVSPADPRNHSLEINTWLNNQNCVCVCVCVCVCAGFEVVSEQVLNMLVYTAYLIVLIALWHLHLHCIVYIKPEGLI